MRPPTDQVTAALAYARRGWAVLPCHHPSPGGCSCAIPDCASPAKHPRTRRGLHDATTELHTVRRWWRRWPIANVGLRTGAASGLVVLDVDPDHGGEASLAELVDAHDLRRLWAWSRTRCDRPSPGVKSRCGAPLRSAPHWGIRPPLCVSYFDLKNPVRQR